MALYHATKSYVLSFTEALHTELAPRGIRVTALCPGPVPTEFQERAGFDKSYLPAWITQSPEWVANKGYDGLMRGKRVVVPGWGNKVLRFVVEAAPRRAVLNASASVMKRRRVAAKAWLKRR
jgi:short-subunit dehydrogenase